MVLKGLLGIVRGLCKAVVDDPSSRLHSRLPYHKRRQREHLCVVAAEVNDAFRALRFDGASGTVRLVVENKPRDLLQFLPFTLPRIPIIARNQ